MTLAKPYYLALYACLISLSSCLPYHGGDRIENGAEYSAYEPIYKARADLDASIQLKPLKDIVNSGKIYVKGDLLFVGDKGEGFHVFDNSDAQNPKKIKFIQVPGCTDIAIRNNIMYVNQATDLVTLQFDFDEEKLKITKRIENAFPELRSPDGYYIYNVPKDSVIIKWNLKIK